MMNRISAIGIAIVILSALPDRVIAEPGDARARRADVSRLRRLSLA